MVSVIITAYRSQDFIEACLDSVAKQVYGEILLGIDDCQETLDKVMGIRDRYRNLRILMMKENYGTYIVSNTLMDNAKGDYILRFDSDDAMKTDMIKILVGRNSDIVVMRYHVFGKRVSQPTRFSFGQALFKKKVFDVCGGYAPWKCAADKELLNRAALKFKIEKLDQRLFYKRMHPRALTKAAATGKGSAPRREAHRKLRELSDKGIIKIERITGEYKEL